MNTYEYKYRKEGQKNFLNYYHRFRNVQSWKELANANYEDVLRKAWAEEFGCKFFSGYEEENETSVQVTYKDYEEVKWSFMKPIFSLDYGYDKNFMHHFREFMRILNAWQKEENKILLQDFEIIRSMILDYYNKGYYIGIDTNIIMDFPSILSLLPDTTKLLLSRKVYEELDRLKKGNDKSNKQARDGFRAIEEQQLKGIPLTFITPDIHYVKAKGLDASVADDIIIGTYLKEAEQNGKKVIFLTNDRGARIIARSVGLETIDLQEDSLILPEELNVASEMSFAELERILNGKDPNQKVDNIEITMEDVQDYWDDYRDNIIPSLNNIPSQLRLFLEYHTKFRNKNLTWQDLMRADQMEVKKKIEAERYGEHELEGYHQLESYTDKNPRKVRLKNHYSNLSITVDYAYDSHFCSIYKNLVCKKLVLEHYGGLSYIKKVQQLKNELLSHYENGGYLAFDFYKLINILPLLKTFKDLSRILISQQTMEEIEKQQTNVYDISNLVGSQYLKKIIEKGELPAPLPTNPELVTVNLIEKVGWFRKKVVRSIPTKEELEISSFLPLIENGKNILYIGSYENEQVAKKYNLPIYIPPSGIYFGEKLKQVLLDEEKDLIELCNTDIFILEESYDWQYFEYKFNF